MKEKEGEAIPGNLFMQGVFMSCFCQRTANFGSTHLKVWGKPDGSRRLCSPSDDIIEKKGVEKV